MAKDQTRAPAESSSAEMVVMSAEDAMRAMQAGDVPARLRVEGDLYFYQQQKVAPPRALPTEELMADNIVIHDASPLTSWPRVVRCHELYLWGLQFDFPPDTLLEIDAPAETPSWGVRTLNLQ